MRDVSRTNSHHSLKRWFLTKLFIEFLKTEKAAGAVLILCTIVSLSLANSGLAGSYVSIWQVSVLDHPLSYWINDGLMTLFFLLIGLEIEREIYVGELSQPRNALLPIIAGLGGMTVPALVHLSLNAGTETQAGLGIPMATDIAFALGVLSLLGKRVPLSLKVFLTAFAIIDDLGAVIVIGLFYTKSISMVNLLIALLVIATIAIFNRLGIRNLPVYLASGVLLWYFIHQSGIHSTLAGVILAFLVPFGKGDESSPSYKLQHGLHYLVAFFVLPLFALSNTSLTISGNWYTSLLHPNSAGIILGLIAGKAIGITAFSLLAAKMNLCSLPTSIHWKHIIAVSILGGIGFTMSFFITMLAFQDASLVENSKIAVLIASLIAALVGYWSLRVSLRIQSTAVSA
jgi:NhaA family Na+:H+ antiporter